MFKAKIVPDLNLDEILWKVYSFLPFAMHSGMSFYLSKWPHFNFILENKQVVMLVASTGTVASNYPICSKFSLDGSGCSSVTTCWHTYLPCMSFEARKQLNYEAILALPLILLGDCHNTYFCLPLSLKKGVFKFAAPSCSHWMDWGDFQLEALTSGCKCFVLSGYYYLYL